MPVEMHIPLQSLASFLVVLARVAGLFAFLPIPGWRSIAPVAKAAGSVWLTVALAPVWPQGLRMDPGALLPLLLTEMALGVMAGLSLHLLLDTFQLAAQILGFQAGYSFVSAIDPTSEADSTILQLIAVLFSGLLFFACGLDREVIRAIAASLQTARPGALVRPDVGLEIVLAGGAAMLVTALRLALPIIAFLLFIDLVLAVASRLQAHMQWLSLSFPAKMLAALWLLGATAAAYAALFERSGSQAVGQIRAIFAGAR